MQWLFWDLGDTLLNEDPLRFRLFQFLRDALHEEGHTLSYDEIFAERERLLRAHVSAPHYVIARTYLSESRYNRWAARVSAFVERDGQQLVAPIRGTVALLHELAKSWNMGIIADQPVSVLDTLERFDIRTLFRVTVLSAAVGMNKPDPNMYIRALTEANCSARDAIMIGNRYDMDVAPAKSLGIRTIFCYFSPDEKGWEPHTTDEAAYLSSLRRVPNWPTRLAENELASQPTAFAFSVDELHHAINTLRKQSE